MIARKSALIIFVQLLNGLLGYIALKFIALYMEPWEYGVVGFAYGFVALLSMFGTLGFDDAHIKRVSEGKDLATCIATFAVTKIFLAGLMASIVIGGIAVWKYVLGRGFETPYHETAVYILLAYFVLLTLNQIFTSTFNAKMESARAQLPSLVYTIVRVISTIYVAYNDFGPIALASTYLIGEFFQFLFTILLFKGYPVGKPSLNYFRHYLSFAIHMALAVFSWDIMTNIDKVFIQLFWNATQVGEYFAIFNLTRFLLVLSGAVGTLLLPTVSMHHSNGNLKEVKKLIKKAERYLSMISIPIVIFLILFSYPVIHILLSDKYLSALNILQILPFFIMFEILSSPSNQMLVGMDYPKTVRNRVIVMVVINVILNILLIPHDIKSLGIKLFGLGATGAAIATVISYGIGMIYIKVKAYRISGYKPILNPVFHFLAAIQSGLVVCAMYVSFGIYRWYQLFVSFLVFMGIYYLVLYLSREFKKEDLLLFVDTLNPFKILKYVVGELKNE